MEGHRTSLIKRLFYFFLLGGFVDLPLGLVGDLGEDGRLSDFAGGAADFGV